MNETLMRLVAIYGADIDWRSGNDIYIRNCSPALIALLKAMFPNEDCSKGTACFVEDSTTVRLA